MDIEPIKTQQKLSSSAYMWFGWIWFLVLVQAVILHLSLPTVANHLDSGMMEAVWAIGGFWIGMASIGPLADWLGTYYGYKKVCITAQIIFILATLGCGLSVHMPQLIFFRIFQGASGGAAVTSCRYLFKELTSEDLLPKYRRWVVKLIQLAPAVSMLFSSHVTVYLGWQWFFFIPIFFLMYLLWISWRGLPPDSVHSTQVFDTLGFVLICLTFACFYVATTLIPVSYWVSIGVFLLCAILLIVILNYEKHAHSPLIPFHLFTSKDFMLGNFLTGIGFMIFIGLIFSFSLFLTKEVGYTLIETAWILSSMTVGVFICFAFLPKISKRLNHTVFLFLGLILFAFSLLMMGFLTRDSFTITHLILFFILGIAAILIEFPCHLMVLRSGEKGEEKVTERLYFMIRPISAGWGTLLSAAFIMMLSEDPLRHTFLIMAVFPIIGLIITWILTNESRY